MKSNIKLMKDGKQFVKTSIKVGKSWWKVKKVGIKW